MSTAVAPTLWEYEVASHDAHTHPLEEVAAGDGATLDEAITRLWGEIRGHHTAVCPWCEGEMRPRYAAAPLPVGARCTDCGADLS
jgi:hypothetical protein